MGKARLSVGDFRGKRQTFCCKSDRNRTTVFVSSRAALRQIAALIHLSRMNAFPIRNQFVNDHASYMSGFTSIADEWEAGVTSVNYDFGELLARAEPPK
jgi:hypothetical protein